MRLETKKLLYDVLQAAKNLEQFSSGKSIVDYQADGQSFALARQLRHIAATIRERVLPHEPDRAFELADAFLRSDARVFESMDDSSGTVGDVFRDVCRLWLEAAARCRAKRDWIGVFKEAVAGNDYGARDELVPNAALLFPEAELRAMLAEYLEVAREPFPEGARLDSKGFTASVVASQLAIALRDPKLYEEATRVRSGSLNDLQRMDVAERCLDFGDPSTALEHLLNMAGERSDRLHMLSECYGRLGRTEEQIATLEAHFRCTLSIEVLDEILSLLAPDQREAVRLAARQTALGFQDTCTAAIFLFEADWPEDAERLALERCEDLAHVDYGRLLELAELAERGRRRLVEVVCYRHLIRDVLDDARSRAYGHAVTYLRKLASIDRLLGGYGSLTDHAAFLAELRKRHGRKYGFWNRLEENER